MTDDKRLIEDYLPIEAISAEASREKSVRKGHISTLHLWWARRPLVACRAAVYGALVPANRFVPNGASDDKKKSLGRANAARFVKRLCRYPKESELAEAADIDRAVAEARQHILEAHAERLTRETGEEVTVADIEAGRAPRPKVLDMFAGGGAIPLEALRLGCEAYALDLNPVAHIIELCTLVYPQKYGQPDPTARGMTGPENANGEKSWGGLAKEVRYWGEWVLKKVKAEIGDLYPLIPDPAYKKKRKPVTDLYGTKDEAPPGYLVPVAYLWTRTVTCKNRSCRATVPLVRQTWLCKKAGKKGRYVALAIEKRRGANQVRFSVVESAKETDLGFDPAGFSKAGNATCPYCGTVADNDYVKVEGRANRIGMQPMAVICNRPKARGKVYLAVDDVAAGLLPDIAECDRRITELCARTGITVPEEPVVNDAKNANYCILYGLDRFSKLFTRRQLYSLLTFVAAVREAHREMTNTSLAFALDHVRAITTYIALLASKVSMYANSLCVWNAGKEHTVHCFGRQAMPMTWDFPEANVANPTGNPHEALKGILAAIECTTDCAFPAEVRRGSATALPWEAGKFDAVATDPPYYDNVPYADISDFFYVWLKRTVGHLYPEDFGGQGTPKKLEVVADATRHSGDRKKAVCAYEDMMAKSLAEGYRVLKPGGQLTVVYAHKTTLGWSTLVDALRRAGFVVTEAWPLDTEGYRLRALDSAALASSIFLVGRKRDGKATGSYEDQVQPELEAIVRERVETLWIQGISGADLVIACVGAGLRAFTRFASVQYANGDEVPAERFLSEVETVVLDTILGRLSKEVGGQGTSLAGLDPATRFYILWRYTYRAADLEAGEAIIFANGTHVELDGPTGMSSGADALVEKKKGKYRLRDFTERGDDDGLGQPTEDGQAASLVDVLHRVLWLMENQPRELATFLRGAEPNREQLRLVAQALAGPALKGSELEKISPTAEQSALAKLTANWRSVIEDNAVPATERAERKRGQKKLFE